MDFELKTFLFDAHISCENLFYKTDYWSLLSIKAWIILIWTLFKVCGDYTALFCTFSDSGKIFISIFVQLQYFSKGLTHTSMDMFMDIFALLPF